MKQIPRAPFAAVFLQNEEFKKNGASENGGMVK